MPTRSKRIGLLLDLTDSYDLEVAKGVLRFARQRPDWHLLGQIWRFNQVEDFKNWKGDGIITRIFDLHMYRRNTPAKTAVVDVAGTEEKPDYAQVTNDDDLTGYLAGKHLIESGFRQAAFLGVKANGWSEKRREGLERAFREAGIPEIQKWEVADRWLWNPEKYDHLKSWLLSLPKPCGLVVTDDAMAMKAVRAIGETGITMPGDLGVVVAGNEDALFAVADPTLTAITCDCQRIGYEAARRLDEIMGSRNGTIEPTRVHPRPLIARASTSGQTVSDAGVAKALAHIRQNAHKKIAPLDVARHARVPLPSLEERFKSLIGHSLEDDLLRTRLELARTRLETGSTPTEAAKAAGIAPNRFVAAFKRHLGVSPKEYADGRCERA